MKSATQTDLVFGAHAVIELIRAKRRQLVTIYTTKPEPQIWRQIAPLLSPRVTIQYVPRTTLTRIAGTPDHQGVVAWATPFPYQTKMFDPVRQPCIALLDGIQDPRNVGAIIRSAYCAGFSGVVLVRKGASPLTATAIKASAGLAEHLPIYLAPSSERAVSEIKKAGYQILGAMLGGAPVSAVKSQLPLCVAIGSEGVGLSREVRNACTPIMLPQKTPDISYNASVAAGILFYLFATEHKLL